MNKSKKILLLLHLPPPIHGSSIVGLYIKESVLINKAFDCSYINILASENVAESGRVNLRKIFSFVITFTKVFITLVKKRPQLCYLALTSSGAAFYKDLLLVALLKVFKIKLVYHLHNKSFSIHKNKIIAQICYQFVFSGAHVILLSKHLITDIKQFVPLSRIYICPNGIRDEGLSAKGIVQKSKNVVQILFLSNLIESKGILVLLEACVLLKKKELLFKCVFIGVEGDVTASQFNEWIIQKGLSEQVCYQGKKYGKEKQQVFLESDIFVFPTYYSKECFPLVLLEAMSYSLPIISTFEGGIRDIVEDGVTGFLVPQKHVELTAKKLERLIKDSSLCQKMGAAGRNKYEQEFTFEKFEQKLTIILQEIIIKN